MKRPALYILIPFCLGIAFAGILNTSILYPILFAGLFTLGAVLFSKNVPASQAALFLALFFTGAALHINSNIIPSSDISNYIPPVEHNDLFVRGTVVDDPVMNMTLYKTVRTSFTLKAGFLKGGASWRKVSGLVKVDLYSKDTPHVKFGDVLVLEGTISKPHGLNNPGLFNYAQYLGTKDIYTTLSSAKPPQVLRCDSAGALKSVAYKIRHKMLELIDEYLAMPYSGFSKAILIGDRTGLTDSVQGDFIKTGTVHVIAVSGLQVGLIAAVFLVIFGFFRIPKKMNLAITTIFVILYSIISGANPPIARAAIMFSLYSLGYIINRETDSLNSLSLAALAILLWNPKDLYDPSFQLSFASLASTLIFTPGLNAIFPAIPEGRFRKGWSSIYRYTTTSISVSVAAWLGSFPIVAAYFNIVSPVAVIANLIVIPMLFLLVAIAFVFFAASFVSAYGALIFANGLQCAERVLFSVNGYLANSPFAYFRIGRPSAWFTLIYYALAGLTLLPPVIKFAKVKITRVRIAIAILVLCNLLVWPSALGYGSADMKMTVFDVGQGDSVFMEFARRCNILIDGGSGGIEDRFDMGKSVVAPSLWNRGVGTIDLLVITHFHEDHAGGILYLLKNFKVGCVIDNGAEPDNEKMHAEYLRLIKEKKMRRIAVKEGDIIKVAGGVEIFILNPERDKKIADTNDNSLVLKLVYKKKNFMLCGDIKDRAISRLMAYGDFLKSDVIKVPHHGGDLGNTKIVEQFFNAVSPKISVISVGAANRYGMPSKRTTDIITLLNSADYITKDSGAIEITNNKSGILKAKKAAKI